jgi:heterodisulfide reductase subunit B
MLLTHEAWLFLIVIQPQRIKRTILYALHNVAVHVGCGMFNRIT